MKNIYRFLIGLGISLVSLGFLLLIIALLTPLAIITTILGSALLLILIIIYLTGMAFAFVFYLSRNEKQPNPNKTYSIKQGKEIK